MSGIRKVSTVAATFSVALGLGFLVQNDDASAARFTPIADRPDGSAVESMMLSTDANGASVFGMPNIVTTPLPYLTNLQNVTEVDEVYDEVATPKMGTVFAAPLGECQTDMIGEAGAAAMVELAVTSPCHPDSGFTLTHEGLMFSGKTDADGNVVIRVPALTANATFAISFDNLEVARVGLAVADFNLYDRAVLQWRGSHNLQLHALEFGATFGDPGHVWSASANQIELAQSGNRGFITRLGNSDVDIPYHAEIYTFPSGLSNRDGQIVLQVGVAVTDANCAREIKAQSIQSHSGQMVVAKDLNIPMPDCGAVGESLMLRNMMQDVTLALR